MEVFGVTQTTFSLLFAMNVIGLMSGNFINARLVGKFGSKRMLRAANLIALVCAIILLFAMLKGLGLAWCVSLIIPIMGCVMIMINNADAMILLQFKQQAATASAVIGS
ncbi:MAG: Bcr/CflA family drug resistance efflux transporter, partial [Phototrophicales bacterium]